MATIIKSVSVSEEDHEFMEEFKLSPSGLLKQRIDQIKEFHNKSSYPRILQLEATIKFLNDKLQEANDNVQQKT